LDYLTTHISLLPIRRGFAPGFVNYKKGCTRLTAASDKVYQLLAHGRWFSPGTLASSTTKNWSSWYSWNIAESGVEHQISNQIICSTFPLSTCCGRIKLHSAYHFIIYSLSSIMLSFITFCVNYIFYQLIQHNITIFNYLWYIIESI
jgi:hypothetical protein